MKGFYQASLLPPHLNVILLVLLSPRNYGMNLLKPLSQSPIRMPSALPNRQQHSVSHVEIVLVLEAASTAIVYVPSVPEAVISPFFIS